MMECESLLPPVVDATSTTRHIGSNESDGELSAIDDGSSSQGAINRALDDAILIEHIPRKAASSSLALPNGTVFHDDSSLDDSLGHSQASKPPSFYETLDDLIEVSTESTEIGSSGFTQSSSTPEEAYCISKAEMTASSKGDRNFLQKFGRSLRSLFCASSNYDASGGSMKEKRSASSGYEDNDTIPMQNIAHTWITQATTSEACKLPVITSTFHQSLVIDLPPPLAKPILPDCLEADFNKKCLVLDLDETLVHSSFLPVPSPDYILSLPLGLLDPNYPHTQQQQQLRHFQNVYVSKRPGVDVFLERVCKVFEVVLFTASLPNYADPVINFLDPEHRIRHRLYREDCVLLQGLYIKDLSRLGRSLDRTLIVDNSPASYLLQPQCAIAIKSWFNDPDDLELSRLLPALTAFATCDMGVGEWRETWSMAQ